jgi:hypothetical protein
VCRGELSPSEEQWQQRPHERVVRVVDQPDPSADTQETVPEQRTDPQISPEAHDGVGISDDQRTQERSDEDNHQTQREGLGPDPEALGKEPGNECGYPDGGIARELVESGGTASFVVAGELDLHQQGRRPSEPLVDPQQQVGGDDPSPRRRPHQQQRYRDADQPSHDEDAPGAEALGQQARDEVTGGLRQAEGHQEERCGKPRGEPEVSLREEGDQRALLADQGSDQRVDPDQESELREVRPDPLPHGPRHARQYTIQANT